MSRRFFQWGKGKSRRHVREWAAATQHRGMPCVQPVIGSLVLLSLRTYLGPHTSTSLLKCSSAPTSRLETSQTGIVHTQPRAGRLSSGWLKLETKPRNIYKKHISAAFSCRIEIQKRKTDKWIMISMTVGGGGDKKRAVTTQFSLQLSSLFISASPDQTIYGQIYLLDCYGNTVNKVWS